MFCALKITVPVGTSKEVYWYWTSVHMDRHHLVSFSALLCYWPWTCSPTRNGTLQHFIICAVWFCTCGMAKHTMLQKSLTGKPDMFEQRLLYIHTVQTELGCLRINRSFCPLSRLQDKSLVAHWDLLQRMLVTLMWLLCSADCAGIDIPANRHGRAKIWYVCKECHPSALRLLLTHNSLPTS